MKIGKSVTHVENKEARGVIITEGKSTRGQQFFIVGWFTEEDGKKRCVKTTRNAPTELMAV
jgi:hypothetical protein